MRKVSPGAIDYNVDVGLRFEELLHNSRIKNNIRVQEEKASFHLLLCHKERSKLAGFAEAIVVIVTDVGQIDLFFFVSAYDHNILHATLVEGVDLSLQNCLAFDLQHCFGAVLREREQGFLEPSCYNDRSHVVPPRQEKLLFILLQFWHTH